MRGLLKVAALISAIGFVALAVFATRRSSTEMGRPRASHEPDSGLEVAAPEVSHLASSKAFGAPITGLGNERGFGLKGTRDAKGIGHLVAAGDQEPMLHVDRGSIDKALVSNEIHRNRAQIRDCYDREVADRTGPALASPSVTFVISESGAVSRADVTKTSGIAGLDRCLTERVRTWTFPKPSGGEVVVTYPFIVHFAP